VEWYYERQSWSSDDAAGAFASPLKLPVAGRRDHQSGSIGFEGYYGIYWSSYVDSEYWAFGMRIDPDEAYDVANRRADGCSVRCIKD
jgi:uncharacterized protein (TIGR02145 family)